MSDFTNTHYFLLLIIIFFTESLSSHCVEDINSHAHLKKIKGRVATIDIGKIEIKIKIIRSHVSSMVLKYKTLLITM